MGGTMRKGKIVGCAIGTVAGLVLGAALAVAPAHASTDLAAPDYVTVTVQRAAEPKVRPAPGDEVVDRSVPGEVTTYYGVTAACTESVTAYTPFKSGNQVKANVGFNRSAGCSGSNQGNGRLQAERGIIASWHDRASKTITNITPGTNVSSGMVWNCAGTASTKWRNQGFFGNASGVPTNSSIVTLACGS